nr:hypothetical protein Itr_chr09CG16100 [Ipomoea trifida]GMC63101.1 hypothetical protein Iba_chr02cCG10130 [Ipomoea batatas]
MDLCTEFKLKPSLSSSPVNQAAMVSLPHRGIAVHRPPVVGDQRSTFAIGDCPHSFAGGPCLALCIYTEKAKGSGMATHV